MTYTVYVEEVEPQLVATTRSHSSLRTIATDIGVGFAKLSEALANQGVHPIGGPMVIYHEKFDEDTAGEIELCIGIETGLEESLDVHSRVLEGGQMAVTLHQGSYTSIGAAYDAITHWISEHGNEFGGPPREIYLNDPALVAEEELLTRVEYPVRPRSH